MYSNKSTVLAGKWDGDWQVAESEEDVSSEVSTIEAETPEEIVVEVHAPETESICQGSYFSPTKGIKDIIYEDDITTEPPVCAKETTATDSDEELDEAISTVGGQEEITASDRAMEQQDEVITITEAREMMAARDGAMMGDEWLAKHVSQVEYEYDEEDCSQFDDDDVPRDDGFQNSTSVQDDYHAEFTAFYANYEEGADYFREEDGDDAGVYEEDGD